MQPRCTAYHVDSRIASSVSRSALARRLPERIANVGSVKTNGVEAALSWRAFEDFTWFTSAAWNQSEYDDNYTVADSEAIRS